MSDGQLPGGADHGAVRRGDAVRRVAGPWTPTVHHLLGWLADQGFAGAPRPLRLLPALDPPQSEVSYLVGETVGDARPWPPWVHSDPALVQTAAWLASYHRVVRDYVPPADAVWREHHAVAGPDVLIAHNDAAPYNAVWRDATLVGFVDWDMAGPRHRLDDLAWTAFSWVPLHAEHVVAAEGFSAFGRRRERLEMFLRAYGSELTDDQVIDRLSGLLTAQIAMMSARALGGDESYRRMLDAGRADDLRTARDQLGELARSSSG